jgi:hypothetical protein
MSSGLSALGACVLTARSLCVADPSAVIPPGPLPTRLLTASEGEEGMSLQIFVAFTGDRLLADPISFAS